MKIYVMGPVGSGKTTFATKLSEKYHIPYYELDKVSWDDDHGNIKRSDEEALKIFQEILDQDSWVMEDVGRTLFKQGRVDADTIYYLKLSRIKSYLRVNKRWFRQRFGRERYNCPPDFKQWLYYIHTVNSYYKKQKQKLKDLEEFQDKVVFVTNKDMKKILK